MNDKKRQQAIRVQNYARLIEQQTGRAVRPFRADGYVNLMNRYGTSKDATEHYKFVPEANVPDETFTMFYEGNGLFAKVIDAPAEEAIKHGFTLDDVSDQEVETFYQEALDELDWEEVAMTGIKWARLFGGAIAVMLINDGGGLEQPLNWQNIQSIDDIRVYDRSVIQPDYSTMFSYDPRDPFRTRGSRLGMPEFYHVSSRFGSFTVHESRCLVFQNGVLPENSSNTIYQLWGMPEYIRIHRALRDAELAHSSGPKMLDRSVQPVYKMKDLASLLATEEGESQVLKRLQVIDMARGLLNSLVIDNEGEDYDFKSFQFTGVADVIDATCNFLSALTNIPQTILFGRSPAGMNSTGESDLENWYSYVGRIQKRMIKSNLRYLLSIIFQAGVQTGEVDEVPKIKVKFNPLKTLSDTQQAELDNKKASTELVKAQTVQIYRDMEAIDSTEIRRKLADSGEFEIGTILDEYEDEEDLLTAYAGQDEESQTVASEKAGPGQLLTKDKLHQYGTEVDVEEHETDPGTEGSAPANAPAATKLPQDMSEEEKEIAKDGEDAQEYASRRWKEINTDEAPFGVGVLVIRDGRILCGKRHNDSGYGLICGPGGHGEKGESPEQAAYRETEEEFGISPKELIPVGIGPFEPESGLRSHIFLCTEFEGEPDCVDHEMVDPKFLALDELEALKPSLFPPFADSLDILSGELFGGNENRADDDWITVNGTHVLIDDSGNALGGGKLKGKNFSKAKSQKRPTSGKTGGGGGKYKKLSDEVSKVKDSNMSKEEKGEAYKKMVRDAEPGTTFKINGMECRKSSDPDYPIEVIDFEGKTINSYQNMDFDLEYYADKENCLTFFDKEAQIAERKKAAVAMKESGKFSVSDSVHGEKPGKITEASANFGSEGDYVVYRNGSIGSSGMIFFAPKKEQADTYSSLHDSGNTGQYEVHLKNPLVINGTTEVECIKKAYERLHPGKTIKGPLTSSKWISSDKANASALNSGVGGYDSIVYVLNGKPHEVQVSAKKAKKDVAKTGEYTTTKWSRSGHTYEEAAMRGYITEGAEDYKRVDSNTDGFGDDGVHCSEAKYDEILAETCE